MSVEFVLSAVGWVFYLSVVVHLAVEVPRSFPDAHWTDVPGQP